MRVVGDGVTSRSSDLVFTGGNPWITAVDIEEPDEAPSVDALLRADTGGMVDEELRLHVLAVHQALARVQAQAVDATGRFERRGSAPR